MKTKITVLFALLVSFAVCGMCSSSGDAGNDPLARPGVPGMCRGMLHLMSAPLLIPRAFVCGIVAPFQDTDEGGVTNSAARIAVQSATLPLSIAANTGVGAGGCCLEMLIGTMDILSCGYYGLPADRESGEIDTRPYFLQVTARPWRQEFWRRPADPAVPDGALARLDTPPPRL